MQYLIGIIVLVLLASGAYFAVRKETTPPSAQSSNEQGKQAEERELQSGPRLDMSGQGLTKVPSSVFDRTDIVELDLSGNALEGALQAEVRHLQKLKVLDLSDNRFTGVPAEVGQLKELETLDLSNNQLTGLPYEIGNLSKLRLLDISGNAYAAADLERIRAKLPASVVIKTE